jgi:GNAT superfamily N-acetyltransferase
MDMITVSDKASLLPHRAAIETLFLECFGDRLSAALWEWAYLHNPNGEPVVALCYDEGKLVGHYAIVAMPLHGTEGRRNAYLSMTTMVAASHRQHGVFVKLAAATYARARELGIDFVMGFPNGASTPGFRKRLEWTLPEPDYVAAVSKAELLAAAGTLAELGQGAFALDLGDVATREWRMARPGADYVWRDGLMFKQFGATLDLLYVAAPLALAQLPADATVNLLLPHSCPIFVEKKVFDYQFGGISLCNNFEPQRILRQMCLSDVF